MVASRPLGSSQHPWATFAKLHVCSIHLPRQRRAASTIYTTRPPPNHLVLAPTIPTQLPHSTLLRAPWGRGNRGGQRGLQTESYARSAPFAPFVMSTGCCWLKCSRDIPFSGVLLTLTRLAPSTQTVPSCSLSVATPLLHACPGHTNTKKCDAALCEQVTD